MGRWEKRRWKKRWRKSSRLGLLLAKFRELRLRASGATVGLLRTGERISRSIAESYEFLNVLNFLTWMVFPLTFFGRYDKKWGLFLQLLMVIDLFLF